MPKKQGSAKPTKTGKARPRRARKAAPKRKSKRGAKQGSIGVVIAQCEGDLSRLLDMDALIKRIRGNERVGPVKVETYPCTRREVEDIAVWLAHQRTSRVVIAGCSERLYGKLYRDALERAGIDPSLVEFANIRDHGALVHRGSRQLATSSSADLIDIAVARVAGASPKERIEADVKPICLVIGGGVAGISTATALASRGVKVVIIDKEAGMGGLLNRLNIVFPSYMPAADFLASQVEHLEGASIEAKLGVEPVSLRGRVGDFEVELSNGDKMEVGAIVVATGADLLVPEGLFGYGQQEGVLTQVEFEALMKRGEDPGADIVMIQCAGSRSEERPYCSRICCTASIKNAILIKQRFPQAKVTILSRGFAGYAGDLDRAREMGVDIIRYSLEQPPVVGDRVIEVYDQISEMETHIPFDRVVLAVPMLPRESNQELAKILRIPTDEFGFLVEPHLKLRPEEYVPRGIFVAGCAHWPSTITECIVQGYGAASRAYDLVSAGKIQRYATVTKVQDDFCRGCGRCEDVCQHGAIELTVDEDGIKRARVVPIQCVGCGVCVSVCPSGALSLGDVSSHQAGLTVEAVGGH